MIGDCEAVLQGRENGIANLEKLRPITADVEKRAEKAKVRFMVEDGNTVDDVNGNPVADDNALILMRLLVLVVW